MKPANLAPPAPTDTEPAQDGALDAAPFRDAVLVHVVRQYKPSVGGLEDFVASLVARQRGRFRRIRIITCDRLFRGDGRKLAKREIIDGAEVVRLPYFGSTRYPICMGVLSELADADLVHVHAIDFFFDALAFTRQLHRKPLVATTHGGFFHSPDYRLLKRIWFRSITKAAARRYGALACCSESDYERFARIAPDKVRLIENGVDIEKFAGAGSPAPAKSLITIGRLAHNKRVDLLLDTMARLVASDPDWRLSIVGTPFDWSRDDVAAMIADRGLDGHVDLHVGPSDAEMRDLLGNASLFVSASRHEGFGIALIEAMSAGLSSVVEGNDAFAAFAQKHSGITLCDYGDPDATADAIRAAFAVIETDPQAARDTAIAQAQAYSWDATALRYEALYREVLGR
jgi:alpha-1,3-mannosyltransferase